MGRTLCLPTIRYGAYIVFTHHSLWDVHCAPGGYTNVLPIDVMSKQGARKIVAVNVSTDFGTDTRPFGDALSGVW